MENRRAEARPASRLEACAAGGVFYAGGAGGAARRLGAWRARGIFREGAENDARGGRAPRGGSVAMRFHSEVHFNRFGGNTFVSEKQMCTFFEDFLFPRNKIGF